MSHGHFEDYPWTDDGRTPPTKPVSWRVSRSNFLNDPPWARKRGRSDRAAWNAQAQWRYTSGPLTGTVAPECQSCGFREHRENLLRFNGRDWVIPALRDEDGICFSCYLEETQIGAVADYWAKMDPPKNEDPAKGTRITTSGLAPLPANFGTGRKR